MKTRIGIVFGGRSGEHEVSVRSAANVISALDPDKYEVVPIAITLEGRWLDPVKSKAMLDGDAAARIETDLERYSADTSAGPGSAQMRALSLLAGEAGERSLDVIFPVLHGTFGEDGTVQGLLDIAGVPYIGCGVLASACGMDKVVMKSLFREAGLPMCRYVWFLRGEWESRREAVIDMVEKALPYPCFVKPANLGSSVGINRADDRDGLASAIDVAAEYDRRIIVEEGLKMREIECAILGNDEPEASLPGEYVIKDKSKTFLDYEEKYSATGNNDFVVPAPVSRELSDKIRHMAVTAFKSIDGSGLARVDFFLRSDTGALLVNEINTMPGLTPASGWPKMWEGSGTKLSDALDKLVELAMDRFKDRSRNRTSRSE